MSKRPSNTSHFALRTSHFTLRTSHLILRTLHLTLRNSHFTLRASHFTLPTSSFRLPTIFILISIFISSQSCYRFKGISIPPEVDTFYVGTFQNKASNSPGGLETEFTDAFIQKIIGSSKLNYDDVDPHIEFNGYLSRFSVSAVAPQQSDDRATTAFNRLTISVNVEYMNKFDEEDNWNQSFSFFSDFESTTDLSSVQDELIETIFAQILEDIFNKSFTNW